MFADYRFYVDWNNDGDFSDDNENITHYVTEATWRRGFDGAQPAHCGAGSCTLQLNNTDGYFSSENVGSPIYGSIVSGRRVRVTMILNSIETIEWQGLLDIITTFSGDAPNGAGGTATLEALGILSRFTEGEFEVALQENITTGEAMGVLLDSDGFPSADRDIDVGQKTISKWWVRGGTSRIEEIYALQDTELGKVFESKDGKFVHHDRSYHFGGSPGSEGSGSASGESQIPRAYYGDSSFLSLWDVEQLNPIDGIFNFIEVPVHAFDHSVDSILVTLADGAGNDGRVPLIVPALGSLDVWFMLGESSPANFVGVYEWSMVDYEANTARDGAGTDITEDVDAVRYDYGPKLKVTFTNGNASPAHMIMLRAHGIAIVEQDPQIIKSEDGPPTDLNTSQGKYRVRKYQYVSKWETDEVDTQAYADHIIATRKDPRSRVRYLIKANKDENHLQEACDIDIDDRIHISAGSAYGMYLDGDYIVDSLVHNVKRPDWVHEVEVTCTIAPTVQLPASNTPYTPKTVTNTTEITPVVTSGSTIINVSVINYVDRIVRVYFNENATLGPLEGMADGVIAHLCLVNTANEEITITFDEDYRVGQEHPESPGPLEIVTDSECSESA